MFKKLYLIIFLLLACKDQSNLNQKESSAYIHSIKSEEILKQFSARIPESVFPRTEVIKFTIPVKNNPIIWYMNTSQYTGHYDFVFEHFESKNKTPKTIYEFNDTEYRSNNRSYELGSIIHYLDSNTWSFELTPGDDLSGDRIAKMYELLKNSSYFGKELKFHPLSKVQEENIKNIPDSILPRIKDIEIFNSVSYQPITKGTTRGFLRFINKENTNNFLSSKNEILLFEELPEQIPYVSGLITLQFQAPLGHLAILTNTRGKPNMALNNKEELNKFLPLLNKYVELKVESQDYLIKEVNIEENIKSEINADKKIILDEDNTYKELTLLSKISITDVNKFGTKAANLGELSIFNKQNKRSELGELSIFIAQFKTAEGFAIPISYYTEHIKKYKINKLIQELLKITKTSSKVEVETLLSKIRMEIEKNELDPRLLKDIQNKLNSFSKTDLIFRSSTNAEDLENFSGAGLYRSIKLHKNPTPQDISQTLKQIWSSVWLSKAFFERENYNIAHDSVGMGVIIQEFVSNVSASGVAITNNPFNKNLPAYLVNVQLNSESVTAAKGNDIPEQHLIYSFNEELEYQTLSNSSLSNGNRILNDKKLLELKKILQTIHNHFTSKWKISTNSVDVEFILSNNFEDITIVQARPYIVRQD